MAKPLEIIDGKKACNKCMLIKPLKEFQLNRGRPNGYCKSCVYELHKARNAANPEKHNARRLAYREARRAVLSEKERERYRKNPERHKRYNKAWRLSNKEKARMTEVVRKYGITRQQYIDAIAVQESKCAICGDPSDAAKRFLHVDHCHKTGAFRGLLCGRCNTGIGQFRESIELLKNAIEYMKRQQARTQLSA